MDDKQQVEYGRLAVELWRACDHPGGMDWIHAVAQKLYERETALREENARKDAVLKEVERERDLAIQHDRQPYPTAAAYEAVCAARTRWQERAEKAEAWSTEIRRAAQALLDALPSCRCHKAYTERGLVDPDCEAHGFEPEVDRLRAILAGKGE